MNELDGFKLKSIVGLRWGTIGFELFCLPFAIKYQYISVDLTPYYLLVVSISLIINIATQISNIRILKNIELQACVEVITFTVLIILSGKLENPFWHFIYFYAAITSFLIRPKKDLYFIPVLFGSMAIVHGMSLKYYVSILFILVPQWLALTALWFSTRWMSLQLLRLVDENRKLKIRTMKDKNLELVGLLSSGVLHEINTPLNTLRLKIDRGIRKNLLEEKDIAVLNKSLSEIETVTKTLGDTQFNFESNLVQGTSIDEFINDNAHLFPKELEINSITSHRAKFSKLNLLISIKTFISNSLEAGATSIKLEIDELNDLVRIKIQDNGPGIPQVILDNIKAPYNSSKGKGRGIGIFSANLNIESMGGQVEFENKNGALVIIYLEKDDD